MCAPITESTAEASLVTQSIWDRIAVAPSMGKSTQWQQLTPRRKKKAFKGSERWQKKGRVKNLKASWLTSNSLSWWLRRRQYFTLSPRGCENTADWGEKKLYKRRERVHPTTISIMTPLSLALPLAVSFSLSEIWQQDDKLPVMALQ